MGAQYGWPLGESSIPPYFLYFFVREMDYHCECEPECEFETAPVPCPKFVYRNFCMDQLYELFNVKGTLIKQHQKEINKLLDLCSQLTHERGHIADIITERTKRFKGSATF
jgi:hypothetical protein